MNKRIFEIISISNRSKYPFKYFNNTIEPGRAIIHIIANNSSNTVDVPDENDVFLRITLTDGVYIEGVHAGDLGGF